MNEFQVVCDLIEGEGRTIGIFNVLDDVCATMSAVKVIIVIVITIVTIVIIILLYKKYKVDLQGDNADRDLQGKLGSTFAQNKHFQGGGHG